MAATILNSPGGMNVGLLFHGALTIIAYGCDRIRYRRH